MSVVLKRLHRGLIQREKEALHVLDGGVTW